MVAVVAMVVVRGEATEGTYSRRKNGEDAEETKSMFGKFFILQKGHLVLLVLVVYWPAQTKYRSLELVVRPDGSGSRPETHESYARLWA